MDNKKILVTGGAGFIGSNLIEKLKYSYSDINITSLDNYFTGKKENEIEGVEYLIGSTIDAREILRGRDFDVVFHFGEYSRIIKSFDDIKIVHESIMVGTPIIIDLCKEWGAKLVYSASSSKFGNNGEDENLSPYAWMKAKMVELIKNYDSWFKLDYEICYFFNVYGPRQIYEGDYATVVAIFEKQFLNNEPLTVVSPGTQSRDFTHVDDIISGILLLVYQNKKMEWHLRSGISLSIIDLAEMFGKNWKLIPERKGERFTSEDFQSDTNKILNWYPKWTVKIWIDKIKSKMKS